MEYDEAMKELVNKSSFQSKELAEDAYWAQRDGYLRKDIEIQILKAEVARLRGALEEMVRRTPHWNKCKYWADHGCVCPLEKAQAALNPKEGDQ